MILGNDLIAAGLKKGWFEIKGGPISTDDIDPTRAPFNTSAIDLHLGNTVQVPVPNASFSIDLRPGGNIASLLNAHSKRFDLTQEQPFKLEPHKFVLANTRERIRLPLSVGVCFNELPSVTSFAARVEGKSSLARCGMLVHFTAPTIHAGFEGTITLEIINLGPFPVMLAPGMPICQLIIEAVLGSVLKTPSQFRGQTQPAGNV